MAPIRSDTFTLGVAVSQLEYALCSTDSSSECRVPRQREAFRPAAEMQLVLGQHLKSAFVRKLLSKIFRLCLCCCFGCPDRSLCFLERRQILVVQFQFSSVCSCSSRCVSASRFSFDSFSARSFFLSSSCVACSATTRFCSASSAAAFTPARCLSSAILVSSMRVCSVLPGPGPNTPRHGPPDVRPP